MRQYRPRTGVSCLVLLLVSFLVFVVVAGQADDQGQEQGVMNNKDMDGVINNPSSKWKLLSSPPSLTVAAYWEAIKNKYSALVTAPLSFLSPTKPNTDFRVKLGEDEDQGTTEMMKGAVGKSMEKTMETIEESAKSAAKMAMGTTDMLKNTISHNTPLTDPLDEL